MFLEACHNIPESLFFFSTLHPLKLSSRFFCSGMPRRSLIRFWFYFK